MSRGVTSRAGIPFQPLHNLHDRGCGREEGCSRRPERAGRSLREPRQEPGSGRAAPRRALGPRPRRGARPEQVIRVRLARGAEPRPAPADLLQPAAPGRDSAGRVGEETPGGDFKPGGRDLLQHAGTLGFCIPPRWGAEGSRTHEGGKGATASERRCSLPRASALVISRITWVSCF